MRCCALTQQQANAAGRNPITLEVHHLFDASTRARQEQRQQTLIHRLELLQARYEDNRLLS
jgi:hypothetical protein